MRELIRRDDAAEPLACNDEHLASVGTHPSEPDAATRRMVEIAQVAASHAQQRAAAEQQLEHHRARANHLQAALDATIQHTEQMVALLQSYVAQEAEGQRRAVEALDQAGARLREIEASAVWRATHPIRAAAIRHPDIAHAMAGAAKLVWWAGTLQLPRRIRLWRDARRSRPALASEPPLGRPPALPLTMPPLCDPAPRFVTVHHDGACRTSHFALGLETRADITVARPIGREHHRRTILVIDHYTPEPDRDAGSRTMFNLLESLVDAGWLVTFWPYNRQYSPVYTPPLERLGIEVLDCRYPGDLKLWLLANGAGLDHLMVSRPDTAADLMHDLIRGNSPAVLSYYGIDLHFARMRKQADIQQCPELLTKAADMERLERRIWRSFDIVLYLSEDEAATVRAMSPATLARAVVPYAFTIPPARQAPPANDRTILFVAGFAHPPNVDAALFLVHDIVPCLEQEIGPVRIVLAGCNPGDAVCALAGPGIEVTGWLSETELAARYARHRVAVVPLRFGAGVKGKVVEALSRGLPLVTTSIGAQGITGLEHIVPVHDDVRGIVAALRTLLTDDNAWLAQSRGQTGFAETRFSRAAMRQSIVAALECAESESQKAQDHSAA